MELIRDLQRRAAERPERLAHCVVGGGSLTFGEWWQQAEKLVSRLSRTCAPGARVGLTFKRTEAVDAAVALLAVWMAEAVPVLLPADRAVNSAVTEELGLVASLNGSNWVWYSTQSDGPQRPTCSDDWRAAAVVLTSGTGGLPKAVAISPIELVREVPERWSEEVMFNLSPLYTGDALGNLVAPLVDGRLVVSLDGVAGTSFWGAVEQYRPTYLKLVPSMIKLITRENRPAISSVRRIGLGSAEIGVGDIADLKAMFPKARIYANYSSTESGRTSLVWRVDDYKTTGWAGELGNPGLGTEVRLVGEDGSVVHKAGVPGEIQLCTKGSHTRRLLTLGGQESAQAADGWVRMGDLGEYDNRGRLWFRCRTAEVVNVGGEKISLRDVDKALQDLPEVAAAATAAVPHPILGSAVVALVIAAKEVDKYEILNAVGRRFRGADRPIRVHVGTEIPLNETGKVSRSEVARVVTSAPVQRAPVNEEAFMQVLRASLGEELSLENSIADSGASSLSLIMLCVDLEWQFGVLLDVFDVLSSPSFAHLAEITRARQEEQDPNV